MRMLLLACCLRAAVGCSAKTPPSSAVESTVSFTGTWWLLSGLEGTVIGRLTIEGDTVTTVDPGGVSARWSFSPDDGGWELRGDQGQVLRAEAGSTGGLILYDARGNATLAAPVVPIPPALVGQWRLRDPAAPESVALELRVSSPDTPPTLTRGNQTLPVSPVQIGGRLGWVASRPDGSTEVRWLHRLPGGQYLIMGKDRGRYRVMHRDGARPPWVAPEP